MPTLTPITKTERVPCGPYARPRYVRPACSLCARALSERVAEARCDACGDALCAGHAEGHVCEEDSDVPF